MTDHRKMSVRELAGGASVAVIGRFVGRLIAMVGDVIAARVLGPIIFGIYSIGWTIFRLIELIVPLGFDMGVIRYGSLYMGRDNAALNNVIFTALRGTLLFGIPLGIVFYLGAPWLAASVFGKPDLALVIRFFAFGFPLAGLLTVLAAVTRLTHVMTYSVVLQDFGQPLLAFVLLILFLMAGSRIIGVLLSDILSYAVLVALGFYILLKLFPDARNSSQPVHAVRQLEFFMFSLASSLTTVLNTLVFWVDRLLIGYFLPAGDSGIYQAVSQISVIFAVVLGGLSRIVIPILVSLHHKNLKNEMEEVYRVSTKWGVYISIPVLIVLLLSPHDVILATYGHEYVSGVPLVYVLIIGQTINLLTGPVGPLLVATGHQNYTFTLSGISLVFNITLNIALVPRWGLLGAAVATSISLSFLYVVALFAAKQKLDLWPYDRRYWKGLFAALGASLSVGLMGLLPVSSAFFSVSIKLLVAIVVFFAILLMARLDNEDKELIEMLRQNIYRR